MPGIDQEDEDRSDRAAQTGGTTESCLPAGRVPATVESGDAWQIPIKSDKRIFGTLRGPSHHALGAEEGSCCWTASSHSELGSRILFARLRQLFRAVSTPEPESGTKLFRFLFALVEPTNQLPNSPHPSRACIETPTYSIMAKRYELQSVKRVFYGMGILIYIIIAANPLYLSHPRRLTPPWMLCSPKASVTLDSSWLN